MCGICGFIGEGSLEDIQAMTDTLIHRGPDAEGIWHDKGAGVYLGHRRLSIIDIDGGAQPMWTVDGALGVIFNGEIYNHLELREELIKEEHLFISDHSDTEVLLHGFRQWGPGLSSRLNGMWAFAIYDRNNKKVFISRDRFGQKPVFYTLQGDTFAFASELTALAKHPCLAMSMSALSLKKYFAYGYIPAPNAIYEHVYKLPAGHNLLFDIRERNFDVEQYWSFVIEPFEEIPPHAEDVWGEQIRYLLSQSVNRRLMSDVPLGVLLSGGIDSSAIISFCVNASPGLGVKTFSIGFSEESFDETVYSNEVAGILGTEHHHDVLSVDKAETLAPEIVARLDEPMGDSSLIPSFLLCKMARKYVTVVLGGDGADELFAGYDPFKALHYAGLYNRFIPKPIHFVIKLMTSFVLPVSHNNMSLDFKTKRVLRGLDQSMKYWNPVWLGTLGPNGLEQLFQEPVDLEEVYEEAIVAWERCHQENIIDKTLQFYTNLYLQDDILVKMDRASMMNSLEVRSPFLDIDFVDFVRRIPSSYKLKGKQTKYILKQALFPVLPLEILYRPKKGFGVPIGMWFKEGKLTANWSQMNDGVLNRRHLKKLLKKHKSNHSDNRAALWNGWLLNTWLKKGSA